MDNRAIALKLILDHLETNSIATVDQRMEVQKAVYLAQNLGVDLGYSYGWYVKGPYSPALTRDYYNLTDEVPEGTILRPVAIERLNVVRLLMDAPIDGLTRPRKLELLASLHYLIKRSGMSEGAAKKHLATVKPHLQDHASQGLEILKANDLL